MTSIPSTTGRGFFRDFLFIKYDSSSENPGSAVKQTGLHLPPCPFKRAWNDEGFAHRPHRALEACPWGQEPGCCRRGLVPGSPQPHHGHTDSKWPTRMEIIHLAQPALHRLGTEEAASKGRPEKQRWREAEAAPAGHISSLGMAGAWMCLYSGIWEGQVPNSQRTAAGFASGCRQRGLLTSHSLRVTPQNQNPGNRRRRV